MFFIFDFSKRKILEGILSFSLIAQPFFARAENLVVLDYPEASNMSVDEKISYLNSYLKKSCPAVKEKDLCRDVCANLLDSGMFQEKIALYYTPEISKSLDEESLCFIFGRGVKYGMSKDIAKLYFEKLVDIDCVKAPKTIFDLLNDENNFINQASCFYSKTEFINYLGKCVNSSAIKYLKKYYEENKGFKEEVFSSFQKFFEDKNREIGEELIDNIVFEVFTSFEIKQLYKKSSLSKNELLKNVVETKLKVYDKNVSEEYIKSLNCASEDLLKIVDSYLYPEISSPFLFNESFCTTKYNLSEKLEELIEPFAEKTNSFSRPFANSTELKSVFRACKDYSVTALLKLDIEDSKMQEYCRELLLDIGFDGFSVIAENYSELTNSFKKYFLEGILLKIIDKEPDDFIREYILKSLNEKTFNELTYPLLLVEKADPRADLQLIQFYNTSKKPRNKELALKYFKNF